MPFLAERKFALLADEMGLGKTPQAIWAADDIMAGNILILCPASVRVHWKRKFIEFSTFDRPCSVVMSGKSEIKPGIVVCSFDLSMRKAIYKKLMAIPYDLVIVDEAHYLKTRTTKRTKAIYGTRCRGGGLAGNRTWLLTGTPAPNNPSELFPMLTFAGVWLKDYWSFVRTFCTGYESDFGFKITGARNVPQLRALLKPIMLRRLKMNVAKDLPSIRFEDVYVEADPGFDKELWFPEYHREEDYYKPRIHKQEQALKTIMLSKPGAEKFVQALEPLADSMSMLRRWMGLVKVKSAVDLIKNDMQDGGIEKLVVFAHHRNVIKALHQELSMFHPVIVYGGTPAEKRQKHIDKFIKGKRCRIFIGQIESAGTGVDGLQEVCHEAIFVESDWVPGKNAQAAMRIHRYGQKKPCRVRFLMVEHTIDEEITKSFRKKAKILSEVFD